MLSDFDLAKQSNDPNVMPTMVRNEQNGVGGHKKPVVHGITEGGSF